MMLALHTHDFTRFATYIVSKKPKAQKSEHKTGEHNASSRLPHALRENEDITELF